MLDHNYIFEDFGTEKLMALATKLPELFGAVTNSRGN